MEKNYKNKRRDFLVNIPLAAAALTLNSAFGFPVEDEFGEGRLFLKLENYSFPEEDLEKLKNGKLESLTLKLECSFDTKRWQFLNTTIKDKSFLEQLREVARKGKVKRRWKRF